jgi:hypothetical protein
MVSMSLPVTGFDGDFYVSPGYSLSGGDNGIPKVGTQVIIQPSRVDYSYRLALLGGQWLFYWPLVLPDFYNLTLCDTLRMQKVKNQMF